MLVVELETQDAEAAVPEPGKMTRCQLCAGIVVDADRRDGLVGLAERQRDERQLPFAGKFHQLLSILDAEQDETVDQRALDIPGEPLVIARRNQGEPRPVFVAGLGDALHQDPGKGILEEVGERIGRCDADGVRLAGSEQPATRVGARVAELPGGFAHPFAHFWPHQVRPAEDVGGRSLRHSGGFRHIAQTHQIACHAGSLSPAFDCAIPRRLYRFNFCLTQAVIGVWIEPIQRISPSEN